MNEDAKVTSLADFRAKKEADEDFNIFASITPEDVFDELVEAARLVDDAKEQRPELIAGATEAVASHFASLSQAEINERVAALVLMSISSADAVDAATDVIEALNERLNATR